MASHQLVLRTAVLALSTGVLLSVSSGPAHASCAGLPEPSPHAFTGTVIETAKHDRVATVVTDEGREVQVIGTPDGGLFGTGRSSVDRRYALGARYEFHPLNSEPPYRDNACSATVHLAGPDLAVEAVAEARSAPNRLPGWLPVDEQAGAVGYLLFGAASAAPIAAVGAVLRWRHRRSRAPHPAKQPA
jgi:hypothetical protein